MEKERDKIVSIEWHNLSIAQLLYVEAVVMPAITAVIMEHVDDIKELREEI